MNVTEALLESWNRQSRMVAAVASLVNQENRHVKPSPDGEGLDHHLAHIHKVRQYFLSQVAPVKGDALPTVFQNHWENPIYDLDAIKSALNLSAATVREVVEESLSSGSDLAGYDHPVIFLQHLVWHEGWHVGLLILGLRLNGQEPTEEWEEANIWGVWREEV
jgi:uncharacterized damage-inducible protein DinB